MDTDLSSQGTPFFAGAMGWFRNPHSHSEQPIEAEDACQLLVFASYLLGIVDERVAARELPT